ncbi:hypothetical protein Y032_0029g1912 [Ancylostoma ceylanicum]|uniref:Uncharacterized protein n=1 Tax=Ancylostoma ceylanicum TaxID=53326 RepID=A0A016UTP0_9BILA|nr:hypothetical protein Y032_0029g1912 [Ancylostoma ceylanicum]
MTPPLIPPRGEVNAADAFDIGNFDDDEVKGVKAAAEEEWRWIEIARHCARIITTSRVLLACSFESFLYMLFQTVARAPIFVSSLLSYDF